MLKIKKNPATQNLIETKMCSGDFDSKRWTLFEIYIVLQIFHNLIVMEDISIIFSFLLSVSLLLPQNVN